MTHAVILILGLAVAGCQTPTTSAISRACSPPKSFRFSGGDGSSYERAIIVHAPDQGSGVDAMYGYMKTRYPKYEMTGRSVAPVKEKLYDIYELTAPDGKKRELYFDVTKCWPPAKDI